MGYDPTKPEPDHNTLRVGLAGLAMAAVLIIIFLTVMMYLYNVLHIPVR
ncbi:MAG TPA: hypothetical protein VGD78_22650 [Chthoniobacterales bacterium]